ncbi:hypothetical protein V6C03_09155 [Methyloligella sp. 2.7D]|uniref:hypothetical protein n=1 Tax=unclassified Methyloligella TaxID=2625955 RepID=UPI00157C9952|nr:hypothetical protein [Methyloligella sp. GL2]QKP77974.1 hypothetical protein HT051_11295 [Methyloligella sp. GL2]
MKNATKIAFLVFGLVALAGLDAAPAFAGCELIRATNSASTPREAVIASQANAKEVAEATRKRRGWSYVTMRARKVKPDPFWKAVRPVVPPEILIKPDVVTSKTYTQCWPGVVVPYVCTSGSVACGN